jgi:hypothetical protein
MLHSSVCHIPRFIRSVLLPRAKRFFLMLTPTVLLVVWLLAIAPASASPAPNSYQLTAQPPATLSTQTGFIPATIPDVPAVNEAGTLNFTPEYFGGAKGNASVVAVGDVNGDDSLDIVTNYAVYLNDEHGGFGTRIHSPSRFNRPNSRSCR